MAELPTREELELLRKTGGQAALSWYAYRNYLRAIPLMGDVPFTDVWKEEAIKHAFSIYRVSFIFPQIMLGENCSPESIADLARYAAASGEIEYDYINILGYPAADTLKAPYQNWTDGVMDSVDASINSTLAMRFPSESIQAEEQAKRDYHALIKLGVENHDWLQIPLWESEPAALRTCRKQFMKELEKVNLSFIADDWDKLWKMKPLGQHTKNYLKDISEADLDNPEALRRIILADEADKIHAVRTLLLGPGGAGKSSLADRLQGKPVEQIKAATPGIEYQNHQPLDLQKTFPESNPEQKDLNLYLWDFGGQTIFHGLHRAFLHENCVYILVVDSRHEQAPDEWLHQIRHLAGGNATVLLITNQHDGCDIRQNEKRLLREFPDLLDKDSFHYFSCIDPEAPELKTFVNELTRAALSSQMETWKETLNIHQAIREYTEEKSAVFITLRQIKKIISDNGRVEDSKAMINSLEQLGFLASITKGKLSYCLKPEWAVDRAYELLYSDTLRNNQGKLDMFTFDECFKVAQTEDQQSKLLDFLDHRSLCFELPESGEYFFPDAAIADEPETVAELLKQDQRLQIRFDLPYLPLGFHTRLVKPLFNQETGIQSSQHIWKQGFIQQSENSHAIVQYLLRKSSIEVTLVGNPQHYARLLKKFYTALCAAVGENKTGLQIFTIRPFVFLEKQLFELDRVKESQAFSVHSVVELVKVLQAANGDLKQVYEDVRDMAADKKGGITVQGDYFEGDRNELNAKKIGDGPISLGGSGHTVNQHIDKSHTEITADQRQQIATIVGELLKDAANLPTEQLVAVTETKKALEAPVDDTESRKLLGTVWKGINEIADFTKNKGIPIAEKVLEHKESLGAALVTAKSVLGA